MIAYIARRLLILPIILFGVSMLIFSMIMMLGPYQRLSTYINDPAQLKGAEDIDQLVSKYGLNDPWYEQYGRWIGGVLKGDFGWSESAGAPVTKAIADRFPATLELALLSLVPVIFGGIILGVLSAVHHNKALDHTIRIFCSNWMVISIICFWINCFDDFLWCFRLVASRKIIKLGYRDSSLSRFC